MESLLPELTLVQLSSHEKIGVHKPCGLQLVLSPLWRLVQSHTTATSAGFWCEEAIPSNTLWGRSQWQASLRGSKNPRLARKQTVHIPGNTTTCQTLLWTLEMYFPAPKTCNQDAENPIAELKPKPLPKTWTAKWSSWNRLGEESDNMIHLRSLESSSNASSCGHSGAPEQSLNPSSATHWLCSLGKVTWALCAYVCPHW